jgi:hypothetical protein
MIDLQPAIRSVILNNVEISSLLPNYNGSEPIFTRRPVPTDAPYPLVLISHVVADNQIDYVKCGRRVLTYDLAVYGLNDSAANYRKVEQIARLIATKFHRIAPYAISMPTGSSLIQSTVIGPLSAPVDDNNKVGRVVILNLEVLLEE